MKSSTIGTGSGKKTVGLRSGGHGLNKEVHYVILFLDLDLLFLSRGLMQQSASTITITATTGEQCVETIVWIYEADLQNKSERHCWCLVDLLRLVSLQP